MKAHELVALCAKAVESSDPMSSTREVLEHLRANVDTIEHALGYISGIGGNARQVFYRSPQPNHAESVLPGRAAHSAARSRDLGGDPPAVGEEKNTLYRCEDGKLRKAGEATLARGAILTMRAETVHVAECLSDTPAIGLHVYGGDILELPRRMWNPETLEEHELDWQLYERFARVASNAASAPLL